MSGVGTDNIMVCMFANQGKTSFLGWVMGSLLGWLMGFSQNCRMLYANRCNKYSRQFR